MFFFFRLNIGYAVQPSCTTVVTIPTQSGPVGTLPTQSSQPVSVPTQTCPQATQNNPLVTRPNQTNPMVSTPSQAGSVDAMQTENVCSVTMPTQTDPVVSVPTQACPVVAMPTQADSVVTTAGVTTASSDCVCVNNQTGKDLAESTRMINNETEMSSDIRNNNERDPADASVVCTALTSNVDHQAVKTGQGDDTGSTSTASPDNSRMNIINQVSMTIQGSKHTVVPVPSCESNFYIQV